jgi:CBS domain-containing protein
MKVRDIMTTDVAKAKPESTLQEIAVMMRDQDTGAIPVVDGDKLLGIVTDRDIVVRCIAEGKDTVDTQAKDLETEEPAIIKPDADVDEAREIMSRKQIRRLPVVDKGRLVGIVSLGDIAVKTQSDVGETLENVSEGVKGTGKKVGSASGKAAGGRRAGATRANARTGSRRKAS